ncbi:hypothetical protein M4I21_04970 [Cellulophaga sp. 20_2_10]|uniref:hypothetical protein n=1 Tax=Cellulophaga sp. 20_2_10 TaxID=2942476 RepID=UPI00201A98A0|nr:hypothetical protein [Cellulophaga sp. 20_2_10]MCL5245149.1 hypothetical protein [Cellulophaga sp. 20_2_10]
MIEEKDFILREVLRLTLLLKQLISKITGLDSGNVSIGIEETEQSLKSKFDLSIKEISEMSNDDLLKIVQGMNETHVEKLIELVFELIKKIRASNENINLEQSELIKKNILMINLLDENSKTFSMERMSIKNVLQRWL